MKRRFIPFLLMVLLILAVSRDAHAWSPGPLRFEDCVRKFDVAVRGRVTKVESVAKKPGGWVLSRATLDVERSYFGIPETKLLTFYFWSHTDNELTLRHIIAIQDRILVFLSTQLDVLKGLKIDPETRYLLQFAKADHRGYLFKIIGAGDSETIQDGIFAKEPELVRTLTAAEAMLAKRSH